MEDKVYYRTFNVELAATLYTLGIPIDGIYPNDTGLMEFFFESNDKLKKTVQDYFDRKLRIEPTVLFLNRKEILWKVKHDSHFTKSHQTTH